MNPELVTPASFAEMNLSPAMLAAIAQMNFSVPTAVQSKTIPVVLNNRDVISLAETGSGKTAAYLIPLVEQLLATPTLNALVLCPTRELASQIGDVLKLLTAGLPEIRYTVIMGGVPMMKQIKSLQRNPQVVIATPGRLIDHVRSRKIDLRRVTKLVLDEADRMFDMGFAPQVNQLVQQIAKERQTLMFSATFPPEVRSLAQRILRSPVELTVQKSHSPPKVIHQKVVEVTGNKKNDLLLDLINAATGSVLVFARTKNRTDRVTRYLEEYGVKVTKIHGNRSQGQRNKSIADFKSGRSTVLVATDIAARGLDIPQVSDVINYDLPVTAEDYVHRIGRTGRAGQSGQAMTLVTPEDRNNWFYIAKKVGYSGPRLSR